MSRRTQILSFVEATSVFTVGIVLLLGINHYYSDQNFEGIYFGISSESLMQTFSAIDLKDKPFSSIYFNHIQPPMFDAIRATIAFFWNSKYGPLEYFVDVGLYTLYVILFGLLSILIFVWMKKATGSRLFAWVATLIWVIHPSPISMASHLDATFLSSILISWMIFEIWLIGRREGSIPRLVIVASLCFFTRAHFQWFFIPVFGICLGFIGVDRRRILLGVGAFSLIVGLYCIKQYMLFGTPYSYGFFGEVLTGSFWIEEVSDRRNNAYELSCAGRTMKSEADCKKLLSGQFSDDLLQLNLTYPEGAKAVSSKYNTEQRWWLSQVHTRIAEQRCSNNFMYCAESLWRSVKQNFPEYWVETWDRRNPVVSDDRGIPWIGFYYRIVSNYPWLILGALLVLVTTVTSQWKRTSIMPIIGVSIVPLYVFVITLVAGNTYDSFEGGRLKFLLEPIIYIFLFVQAYLGVKYIYLGSKGGTNCKKKSILTN